MLNANNPGAPSTSALFQACIWLGWTSNWLASSAMVCSPLERGQGYLGLEGWAVVLPRLFHVLLLRFRHFRSGTLS